MQIRVQSRPSHDLMRDQCDMVMEMDGRHPASEKSQKRNYFFF